MICRLTANGQQWVVNAYVLALAALVAIGGKLGDRFGRVSTFRAGVITFFLASAACGLAPQGELGQDWLIAARALQGVGAALMMPVSAVIVMAAFDVRERGRAMAIYVGLSQVFLAIGPLLGGVLTEHVVAGGLLAQRAGRHRGAGARAHRPPGQHSD